MGPQVHGSAGLGPVCDILFAGGSATLDSNVIEQICGLVTIRSPLIFLDGDKPRVFRAFE